MLNNSQAYIGFLETLISEAQYLRLNYVQILLEIFQENGGLKLITGYLGVLILVFLDNKLFPVIDGRDKNNPFQSLSQRKPQLDGVFPICQNIRWAG